MSEACLHMYVCVRAGARVGVCSKHRDVGHVVKTRVLIIKLIFDAGNKIIAFRY